MLNGCRLEDDALPAADSGGLHISLEGFEGPLDLLLSLARKQRVDLSRISLADLVDQYVAAVAETDEVDLNRAADWLVMAAWLTWLKSRLLLPDDTVEGKEAGRAAKVLRTRLAQLDRVREAADWLDRRPRLGRDHFAQGYHEERGGPAVTTTYLDLMQACLTVLLQEEERYERTHPLELRSFWTTEKALTHMRGTLAQQPEGAELMSYMPHLPRGASDARLRAAAALAATLMATLELTRVQEAEVEQDDPFGWATVRAKKQIPA